MVESPIFAESEALAAELLKIFQLPLYDDSSRILVSHLACSLSLEHWKATRNLLKSGLLPSALVVHRAQYEAAVRGVWALYAASDIQIGKLASTLSEESEQASKSLPLVAEMLASIDMQTASHPVEMLGRFRETSWKALNSYAHAGIHPLQRHSKGYPVQLFEGSMRNANGIALIATIQAAVLTGSQEIVGRVFALQYSYVDCFPANTGAQPINPMRTRKSARR